MRSLSRRLTALEDHIERRMMLDADAVEAELARCNTAVSLTVRTL